MKSHLSDQQIIDHLFHLDSGAVARQSELHLAACPDCQARQEQLQRKLAHLDALRDDIQAPEQLVADTLRRIRNDDHPARTVFFPHWAWGLTTAAAAAVLMAVLWSGPLAHRRPTQVLSMAITETAPAPLHGVARKQQAERPAPEVMESSVAQPSAGIASAGAEANEPVPADALMMAQAESAPVRHHP